MKKIGFLLLSFVFMPQFNAQTKQGHTNENKFRQMYDLLATPNEQHNATGAPGKGYTQQKVDYVIDVTLDDDKKQITGAETITYHNNSPDKLEFLWVQLDQNMRAKDSKTPDINPNKIPEKLSKTRFEKTFENEPFDGGFNIMSVTNVDGSPLSYTINQTMMRINLLKPLASGEKFKFNINWWYNINNHREVGGRS